MVAVAGSYAPVQSYGGRSSIYNYLVAFSAAMGGLLFGYEIGVVSQVLTMDSFGVFFGVKERLSDGSYDSLPTYDDFSSWVTFTFLIGCVAGSGIVSFLADSIGRKWSIIVGGISFVIGGFVQSFAMNLEGFYSGRVVSGLGIGVLSMVAPLYIGEAAPTHLRGRMVAAQQLMVTIGILIASVINAIIILKVDGASDAQWRLALGMQIIPGAALLVIMFFMPRSPRWLVNTGHHSEALGVLAKLRNAQVSESFVQAEFRDIKESIEAERQIGSAAWSELFKAGIINRVFLGVVLQFFQQWTGINVILYYQSDLFMKMGFDPKAAAIPFTIANNFINFISTFPGMYLVEKWGRRKLLIYGGFGMGIAHLLVFVFLGLLTPISDKFAWGAVFSIYLFFLSFASTWGPVVWVYQSEIFPLRIRAKGTGVSTMANWLANALIAKVSPAISSSIGNYMYLIFFGTGITMALFSIAFVPETMGKSLEEMDELFGSTEPLMKNSA